MEGADVIMVKPSSFYSDIIAEARELAQDVPVATFQVSGEYAMICAAAKAGVFDLRRMAEEALEGCLRAGFPSHRRRWLILGAQFVLSYFTPQALDWLSEEDP